MPVTVNMTKARVIHMNAIRVIRNAELSSLDTPFLRAVEGGDVSTQSEISGKKQALRDIPQTFDLIATTPQQLKAKWPKELPPRNN
tara:strand:+ start:411 stop:668 length:258 start_codon:yes stop_codon:yes gene_type:complete